MGRDAFVRPDFSQLQVSHQEMARIIDTLDEIYDSMKQAGAEWLPVQATGSMLSEELGYEDTDEFEDAIGGTWQDFTDLLPHVIKTEDPAVTGGNKLKIREELPREDWKGTKLTIKVKDSKDLFNSALMKSPYATFKIPHLEFEIQADGKRVFNTTYNHLASALFNLGQHAEMLPGGATQDAILETCESLSTCMDVPEPYVIVIEDPSGMSDFKPLELVEASDMTAEEIAEARIPMPVQRPAAIGMNMGGGGGGLADIGEGEGGDGLDDIDDDE